MQATVQDFDAHTRTGHVVLDDGRQLPFGREAFDESGLRLLRAGQRVRLRATVVGGAVIVDALTIATLRFRDE